MPSIEPLLESLRDGSATHLHLRAGEAPLWRVAGKLVPEGDPLPKGPAFEAMVRELLEAGRLHQLSKSVEADISFRSGGARFRAELFHSEEGYSAVIRRLPDRAPKPEEISVPPAARQLTKIASGLVIVCGPPGSGRTTTVASLVESIGAQSKRHIVTVERPVEFLLAPEGSILHQIEVGVDAPGFAEGIRTALSARANVLAVGDVADGECARLALQAADRGLLVFATLTANGVVEALVRFLDLLPRTDHALHRACLADVFRMALYQVLLPGCDGEVVPAHEMLTANRAGQAMLREGRVRDLSSLFEGAARGAGMRHLDDSLEELARKGLIERETALRRARNRSSLEQRVASVAT